MGHKPNCIKFYEVYKYKETVFMTKMKSLRECPLPVICINDEVDGSAVEHAVYAAHILKAYLRINRTNHSVCILCEKLHQYTGNFRDPWFTCPD